MEWHETFPQLPIQVHLAIVIATVQCIANYFAGITCSAIQVVDESHVCVECLHLLPGLPYTQRLLSI